MKFKGKQKTEMKNKQFFQILLPILLALFAIGFGAFSVISGSENVQLPGNIASIYLLFLFLAPLLFFFLTIILFIILTYKSTNYLVEQYPRLLHFCEHINQLANNFCSIITKPVIEIESRLAIFSKDKTEKKNNV